MCQCHVYRRYCNKSSVRWLFRVWRVPDNWCSSRYPWDHRCRVTVGRYTGQGQTFTDFCLSGPGDSDGLRSNWSRIRDNKWAISSENLFMPFANNKGADQPAHRCSLISTFLVPCLDSIITLVSISEISSLYLASTAAVLCPWARHFTPRKYWLITQEAMAPSRHDWKIVDWDVKPQHNQST